MSVKSVNTTGWGCHGWFVVFKPTARFQQSRQRRSGADNMTTQDQDEKRYDPRDTTLKFVNRPDDLDPIRKYLSRT